MLIPAVFGPFTLVRKEERREAATIAAMDAVDSEILRLLRDDGRLSWRDLGAAVGLSANAAADRVRRLRQAGVITGFAALVDPAAGGRQLEALVGVTLAPGTDSDAFAVAVSRLEPVTEVLHLAGVARLPAPGVLPGHRGAGRAAADAAAARGRGGHRDDDHPALGPAAGGR